MVTISSLFLLLLKQLLLSFWLTWTICFMMNTSIFHLLYVLSMDLAIWSNNCNFSFMSNHRILGKLIDFDVTHKYLFTNFTLFLSFLLLNINFQHQKISIFKTLVNFVAILYTFDFLFRKKPKKYDNLFWLIFIELILINFSIMY